MYLVIDITTEVSTLSVFNDLKFENRLKFTKFPTIYNYSLAIESIIKRIEGLQQEFGNFKEVVVVITGLVDYKQNKMIDSAYLKDYEQRDIGKDIKNYTHCKVTVEQDSVCDALSVLDTYAKNLENYSSITVRYGIGGVHIKRESDCIKIFSTELGHTIVHPNGRPCPCGQRGCVEAYIGAENFKERFLTVPEKVHDLNIWEEAVDYLAIATTNIMMCYPTDNIIYSGTQISTIPYLKNKIKDQLGKRLKVYDQPRIQIASYKEKSNTFGAIKMLELQQNNINIFRIF